MAAGRTAVLAMLLLIAGCGSGDDPEPETQPSRQSAPAGAASPPPRARCPADLAGCRTASGRIAFVESVDPDGDGDAHFVLLSQDGITSPGITVVDVRRDLRPEPLPGVGDSLSAAGPIRPGSYGQRQIEAVEVRASPPP
jgi:hypothetical protein